MNINVQQLINEKPFLTHVRPDCDSAFPISRESLMVAMQEALISFYYQGRGTVMNRVCSYLDGHGMCGLIYGSVLQSRAMHLSCQFIHGSFDIPLFLRRFKELAPNMLPEILGLAHGGDSSCFIASALVDGFLFDDVCDMPDICKRNSIAIRVQQIMEDYGDTRESFIKAWHKDCKVQMFNIVQRKAGIKMYTELMATFESLKKIGYECRHSHKCVQMYWRKGTLKLIPALNTFFGTRENDISSAGGKEHKAFFNEWIDTYHTNMYINLTGTQYLGSTSQHVTFSEMPQGKRGGVSPHITLTRDIVTAFQKAASYPRIEDIGYIETKELMCGGAERYLRRYNIMKSLLLQV